MTTKRNKEIVHSFFERFSSADIDRALVLLDDAVVWRAMGREGELPISGTMYKEDIGSLIQTIKEMMRDGLKLTPTGWTAEDNRVALEMESYGELADGTVYNNLYHFLVTVDGGKITSLKEYMDTLHVMQVFTDK